MADKRTITSTKRARNKRKKAQRSNAKALAAVETEPIEELTPTDGSSGDEAVRRATRPSAAIEAENDDDDELVFVCRPTMHDFCIEYVSPLSLNLGGTPQPWADLKQFTVRIPAFRETRDGFTTYSIVVTTAGDWRKQFQLERRYSEFVAFAAALEEYFHSPAYEELRESILGRQDEDNEEDAGDNQVAPFSWELPPKTWFRMTQATALEDRRSKLETSLQTLLAHDAHVICQVPLVRDFLMLDIFGAQVVEEKLQRV